MASGRRSRWTSAQSARRIQASRCCGPESGVAPVGRGRLFQPPRRSAAEHPGAGRLRGLRADGAGAELRRPGRRRSQGQDCRAAPRRPRFDSRPAAGALSVARRALAVPSQGRRRRHRVHSGPALHGHPLGPAEAAAPGAFHVAGVDWAGRDTRAEPLADHQSRQRRPILRRHRPLHGGDPGGRPGGQAAPEVPSGLHDSGRGRGRPVQGDLRERGRRC